MLLIASILALASKNPDGRYQPMRDDRASFIKSQTNLNTELDALGAVSRGDYKNGYGEPEDDDSLMNQKMGNNKFEPDYNASKTSQNSHYAGDRMQSGSPPRRSPEPYGGAGAYNDRPSMKMYQGFNNDSTRPGSDLPLLQNRSNNSSPNPASQGGAARPPPMSQSGRRVNNTGRGPSPWQVGAGYE
jgi:hypothetical protein